MSIGTRGASEAAVIDVLDGALLAAYAIPV
jgi:hypothetical protein